MKMSDKFPLSIVMLTSNKEDLVGKCLESVRWADDIVILDDCSIDKTVEVAKKYTDKIFIRKLELEGRDRNWAYDQAKNRWVLSLDDDEVVTPELAEEIKRAVSANPQENGFTIPRKNHIGDYWVKYGGWYPSPQLKLFKKDKFRFEEAEIHGRAFMDDPCGHLKCDIIHYTYRDFDHFLRKINRQTTLEALKWYKQNKPMRLPIFIWRSVDRFTRTYIGRKGYKDGFMGFVVAYFAALYQIISYLKYKELEIKRRAKQ
ncbi:glycosyltransferase family 2 protein [bacterium]|nr:MAG: glycosyltransferase family 2 protein [bacterium]